jgi:beta-xylosidase
MRGLIRVCVLVGSLWVGVGGSRVFANSGNGATALGIPQAPSGGAVTDEFSSTTLGGGWFWNAEASDYWSLTDRPGFMRIEMQTGTLEDDGAAKNVLLRATPSTNVSLWTRVEFSATQNFHEAALLLYDDDDNYIKVSRIYHTDHGGPVYLLRREVNGVGSDDASISAPIAATVSELRLTRAGSTVSAAYKADDNDWVVLGSLQLTPSESYGYVGLAAHKGLDGSVATSIPADFDFFRAATLNLLFLPLIHR